MLTHTQKKSAIFVATIASAIFGGIQLWPAFAARSELEPSTQIVNTATAPGGIAIAGSTLGALPSNGSTSPQVVIYNNDPKTLEFLKQEIIEQEKQKNSQRSLEIKLADTDHSLQLWKFWYFRDLHPYSIEMFKDLAALQNYPVRRDFFDARWANHIPAQKTRTIYINDVLLLQGWAIEEGGFLRVSESGLALLKQSGLYVAPYPNGRVISPSFDCRNAEKWYEKLSCSDQELATLDVEMVRLFKQLQTSRTTDAQLINSSQTDWRNKVRNPCQDRNCLIASYTARIQQFKSMGAQ
jgi:hypothetical protein